MIFVYYGGHNAMIEDGPEEVINAVKLAVARGGFIELADKRSGERRYINPAQITHIDGPGTGLPPSGMFKLV